MSKAEDRALEAYPPKMRYVGIDSVKYDRKIDVNKPMRDRYVKAYHQAEKDLTDKAKVSSGWDGFYYGQGYKQAEKDLELTWEDLAIIKQLSDDFVKHNQTPMSDEEYYQEVLKRFKERKEKLNGKDKEKH